MAGTVSHKSNRAALQALAVLATLALLGIVVTRFLPDTGLVKAKETTRAAVSDLAEVEDVLNTTGDFQQFSEALRVAYATHQRSPVRNTADGRVLHLVEQSLESYSVLRETWQTELEGAWDEAIYGDRVYWRAAHPALELPEGNEPLTPDQVAAAAREQAAAYLDEAVRQIGR